jgi:hypothetical protein
MTTSTTTTTKETLPAIVCTPWCRYGDGHVEAWHPDDQWCAGEDRTVRLTRMPLRRFDQEQWLDKRTVYWPGSMRV